MNTRRTTVSLVEEDLANARVPPKENQSPPQGNQVPPQDQAPVIALPMKDGEIKSTFVNLAQDMTTKAKAVAT